MRSAPFRIAPPKFWVPPASLTPRSARATAVDPRPKPGIDPCTRRNRFYRRSSVKSGALPRLEQGLAAVYFFIEA
jgi:hypothetical protein